MAEPMISLTQNEKRIVQLLIERIWPLKVSEIVALTGASRRTVYYSLNNIRYLLKQLGVGELEQQNGGYLLSEEQRDMLKEQLGRKSVQKDKKERISYIICAALSGKALRFKELEECFGISRNAVFADLAEVKRNLAEYHLELKNSKSRGYYVEGDCLLMRTVYQLHIHQLLKEGKEEELPFFEKADLELYKDRMEHINAELDLNMTEATRLELVYLMLMLREEAGAASMQMMDVEVIHRTEEWKAVEQIFTELTEKNKNYLALCLMNLKSGSSFAGDWDEDLELWECTKKLIDLFEIMACVSFDKKNELIQAIYMHMKLSCYNYRNLVPHINPLLEEVQENYPALYKMTKSCCERMLADFPYKVDDSEIAYLTMHFGVGMHNASKQATKARVLISCPNITTSALLLRSEIEKQFDNIIVEDVVKTSEIDYYPFISNIDFVISTVTFESRYPIIRVHPILTDEDKANIVTLMMLLGINSNSDSMQFKILLNIVRRNVDDETYVRIRKDLNRYLNTEGRLVNVPTDYQPGLSDIIRNFGVRYVEKASKDWEKAIQNTAKPLLASGCIRQSYVEKMLTLGREHGPYFVISDDVAVAHARTEDGAEGLGLALSIYREGLTIGDKRVRFLFVLATPNQQDHLHILENVMQFCNDSETREQLIKAENEMDALDLLSVYQ